MSNYSKTDLRYWEQAVRFPKPTSRTYAVHLQYKGTVNGSDFTQRTRNKQRFSRRSSTDILSLGWDEVLRRRKTPMEEKKVNVTVGEYIEAVATKSLFSPRRFRVRAGTA